MADTDNRRVGETEDNGLTWTFHLRKGVKWVDQNGNEG